MIWHTLITVTISALKRNADVSAYMPTVCMLEIAVPPHIFDDQFTQKLMPFPA